MTETDRKRYRERDRQRHVRDSYQLTNSLIWMMSEEGVESIEVTLSVDGEGPKSHSTIRKLMTTRPAAQLIACKYFRAPELTDRSFAQQRTLHWHNQYCEFRASVRDKCETAYSMHGVLIKQGSIYEAIPD